MCLRSKKKNSLCLKGFLGVKEWRFFIFKYLILEIVTFLYCANKEIKTLNREYLHNITAVFFSNKKNRLTAYFLLPCLHSRLQYLSAKKKNKKQKTKTKQKTKQNKYSSLWPLRWDIRACSEHSGTHIAIRLLGVYDPCLRQHIRILVLRNTDPAA